MPLVKRVPEVRLFELVDGLAGKLLGAGKSAKEPQHDMGAIGLKTVVGELAATDAAAAAIKRLAPKLTAYLSSSVPSHLSPLSLSFTMHPSPPPPDVPLAASALKCTKSSRVRARYQEITTSKAYPSITHATRWPRGYATPFL